MVVTRNDVARAAGVSSAVVSYVLNDGPRPVSPATRERVLAAIDALGYRRNTVARSMRTRKTYSIGFVLPEITLSYFSAMTQRLSEIAHARGLSLIVATSNGRIDREREHLIELAGRQVDGIILMSVDPARDLRWTGDLGTPVLLVDRPQVAIDGTAAAVQHLVDRGRRRLGRLSGPADDILTRRRDAGWERALLANDIADGPSRVLRAEMTEAAGYAAARILLTGASLADGVVIDFAPHATGFLRAAADLGIAIPEAVAVVATEFGRGAEFTVPRLTSVDSPLSEIAERAVDAIAAASADDRLLAIHGTDFTLTARESSDVTGSH